MSEKLLIGKRELKPCPFCGENLAELRKWQILDAKPVTYYVLCCHCYVETNAMGAVNEQIAIDRWNTRALNSREKESGWIEIKSEADLPEENGEYEVTRMSETGNRFSTVGYFEREEEYENFNEMWGSCNQSPLFPPVIAWRELPDPFRPFPTAEAGEELFEIERGIF